MFKVAGQPGADVPNSLQLASFLGYHPKMSTVLDEADLRILRCLQRDASVSMDELAARTNLSRNACWRRVKLLEERYADALPELERRVEDYGAKVEGHLRRMGLPA